MLMRLTKALMSDSFLASAFAMNVLSALALGGATVYHKELIHVVTSQTSYNSLLIHCSELANPRRCVGLACICR